MAKISTYSFATPPTLGDYVIGTINIASKETKNFRISDILALSGSGLFVPYTGASGNVNLGSNTISANQFIKLGGTSAEFLKADGSTDSNTYVTSVVLGNYVPYTGATGDVDLSTHNITSNSFIKLSGLPSQFLKADGSTDSSAYLTAITAGTTYVPYTGATANVALGLKSLSGFNITASNSLNTNGPFKTSGDAGLMGQILVSNGPGGAPIWSNHTNGLFAQTSISTPIVFASGEASLIGTGVGTLSVPANAFQIGDSFSAKMCGGLSCANNETIHFRVRSNGIIIIDAAVYTLSIATNKIFDLILDFTVTKIGGATFAELFANGVFTYNKNANSNIDGIHFNQISNTVFDTTVTNTLTITAEWITNNAANTIRSQNFTLSRTY